MRRSGTQEYLRYRRYKMVTLSFIIIDPKNIVIGNINTRIGKKNIGNIGKNQYRQSPST